MKLCTAAEMVALDHGAIKTLGIPGTVLMENAGRACCRHFNNRFNALFPGLVLIVCGKGNNGGDGYVMARILADQGWRVHTLVLAEQEDIKGDARVMLDIILAMKLDVTFTRDELVVQSLFDQFRPAIVVDAIFGTGLSSCVRGLQEKVIALINDHGAPVLAVDIPSGIDGSNGQVCGCAVRAEITVTFAHAKIGHGSQPGAEYSGQLEVVDIGIPFTQQAKFTSQTSLVNLDVASLLMPVRPQSGHKGTFGHALIVAGAPGKSGAAALAGHSASRSGCGLVTVATPASIHDIIEVKLTEAMSVALPATADGSISAQAVAMLEELVVGRSAIAVGPGIGQHEDLGSVLQWLLGHVTVPIVIDADGLNVLSKQIGTLEEATSDAIILTPHPGEMTRLSGYSVAEIESNRYEIARDFAIKHNVILLLKGMRTIIAAPDGRIYINSSGCDALASGGSGDVLTGLIAGLVAQGVEAFEAAALGAWLHGRAAQLVAENSSSAGVIATDLITALPTARHELECQRQKRAVSG